MALKRRVFDGCLKKQDIALSTYSQLRFLSYAHFLLCAIISVYIPYVKSVLDPVDKNPPKPCRSQRVGQVVPFEFPLSEGLPRNGQL